jgi:hypothetical protein
MQDYIREPAFINDNEESVEISVKDGLISFVSRNSVWWPNPWPEDSRRKGAWSAMDRNSLFHSESLGYRTLSIGQNAKY